jgi:hypothetical protein
MDAFFIHFFSRFGNLNLVSIQPGANLVTLGSSVAREVLVMRMTVVIRRITLKTTLYYCMHAYHYRHQPEIQS